MTFSGLFGDYFRIPQIPFSQLAMQETRDGLSSLDKMEKKLNAYEHNISTEFCDEVPVNLAMIEMNIAPIQSIRRELEKIIDVYGENVTLINKTCSLFIERKFTFPAFVVPEYFDSVTTLKAYEKYRSQKKDAMQVHLAKYHEVYREACVGKLLEELKLKSENIISRLNRLNIPVKALPTHYDVSPDVKVCLDTEKFKQKFEEEFKA